MVGRAVILRVDKTPARPGEAVLEVTDLVVEDGLGVERVKGVSFAVRRGEIVGVAGVAGNGQSELLEALAGIRPVKSGRIRWRERDVTDERARSPRRLRRLGLGHVPEDRQRMGLVIPFAARESAILGYPRRGDVQRRHPAPPRRGRVELPAPGRGVRHPAGRRRACPPPRSRAATSRRSCSRASWTATPTSSWSASPRAAWTSAPSSSSTAAWWRSATPARAVLLVSVELDEILALADRILVMHDGHIVGDVGRRRPPSRASAS